MAISCTTISNRIPDGSLDRKYQEDHQSIQTDRILGLTSSPCVIHTQNNMKTNANANALFCQIMLMPMHCFYKLANANANANAQNQF